MFAVGAFVVATLYQHGRLAAAAGGALPLDDAYIHLAVARQLRESATWGVNAGEFANASSSPLWTALLALAPTSSAINAAHALNLAAGLSFGALAYRWLRCQADGAPALGAATAVTILLAVGLAVPLPTLAALGMEHTLHLALAASLLFPPKSLQGKGFRSCGVAALLGAAATLTRYESLFLLVSLVVVAMVSARGRAGAGSALAGGTAAAAAFGAFTAHHGAAWLPNPVLKKAWVGRDWTQSFLDNLHECPALGALGAALLVLVVLGLPPRTRNAAAAVLLTILGQLAFGRVGWLFRYEAWLCGLGGVVLAAGAAHYLRTGPRVVGVMLVGAVLAPLSERAAAAFTSLAPAARFTHDADVLPAEWLATAPVASVAVHDLGAAAWLGDHDWVDVAGIGHDGIARLHRLRTLTPLSLAPILQAHKVQLAVTGPEWMDNARPATFEELARISAPHPAWPGRFEVGFWSTPAADRVALRRSLSAAAATWPRRVVVRYPDDVPVDLARPPLPGTGVQLDDHGLHFYGNAEVSALSPTRGSLHALVEGTEGGGRTPLFEVDVDGRTLSHATTTDGASWDCGKVEVGSAVLLRFTDDTAPGDSGDRNVRVRAVWVR